ncbi:hypothetical protein UABAM_01723 [Candidatus Uabimicrobium amorphum]|uniref:Lipoprotein n=2 Tax=Uabimicrobium amorphum TaxID=2596890 RepID=A0A5S9F2L4_UABAM|nr:hypothetical protein UABAM_01723 [Candidatus Uabimicrobium amorphum]
MVRLRKKSKFYLYALFVCLLFGTGCNTSRNLSKNPPSYYGGFEEAVNFTQTHHFLERNRLGLGEEPLKNLPLLLLFPHYLVFYTVVFMPGLVDIPLSAVGDTVTLPLVFFERSYQAEKEQTKLEMQKKTKVNPKYKTENFTYKSLWEEEYSLTQREIKMLHNKITKMKKNKQDYSNEQNRLEKYKNRLKQLKKIIQNNDE